MEEDDDNSQTNNTSRRKRQSGGRDDIVTVLVRVEDENDNPPRFDGSDGASGSELVAGKECGQLCIWLEKPEFDPNKSELLYKKYTCTCHCIENLDSSKQYVLVSFCWEKFWKSYRLMIIGIINHQCIADHI